MEIAAIPTNAAVLHSSPNKGTKTITAANTMLTHGKVLHSSPNKGTKTLSRRRLL